MTVHCCLRCSFTTTRPGILKDHLKATHNLTDDQVAVDLGRSFSLIAGSAFFNSMQKIPSLVAAARRLAEATDSVDDDTSSPASRPPDPPTAAAGSADEIHDLTTPSPTNDVHPASTHPATTHPRALAPADAGSLTYEDDVPGTPVDAPKPLARLASAALTPESVRTTRRGSAPVLSPFVFTPESAASYSSPTLATVAGMAGSAAVATGFVMGPRPGDADRNKMRVLNDNPAVVHIDADPLVTAVWRAERDLTQADPRSLVPYQLKALNALDATQREFWQNVYPIARIRNLCLACYVARCSGSAPFRHPELYTEEEYALRPSTTTGPGDWDGTPRR
ncbi:hypothetical protein EXIGLDRAFT_781921 [Exidia glandulosa HHB12029]|uniref:Uncharacterized protein n=1 Tax=Exidia glandulosa HHB12029 TaxID=1314781 RepID=A0A165Z662_EXIGL|nr:hypothetical protein EXIGLDRAFT_781921 [Exidia glandulosa HHB12029]